MHLPSAGMSRFRFNGSALLHLSPFRHPEVMGNIAREILGARGGFQWPRLGGAVIRPMIDTLLERGL